MIWFNFLLVPNQSFSERTFCSESVEWSQFSRIAFLLRIGGPKWRKMQNLIIQHAFFKNIQFNIYGSGPDIKNNKLKIEMSAADSRDLALILRSFQIDLN